MCVSDKEMSPAVLPTPRSPAHKEQLMDTTSEACVLCRIEDDASLTPVSGYENIVAGTAAGKHQVEVKDFDFSYTVCLSMVLGWVVSRMDASVIGSGPVGAVG